MQQNREITRAVDVTLRGVSDSVRGSGSYWRSVNLNIWWCPQEPEYGLTDLSCTCGFFDGFQAHKKPVSTPTDGLITAMVRYPSDDRASLFWESLNH